MESSLKQAKIKRPTFLYESPNVSGPRKMTIGSAVRLNIVGYFENFVYVKTETGTEGWIPASAID